MINEADASLCLFRVSHGRRVIMIRTVRKVKVDRKALELDAFGLDPVNREGFSAIIRSKVDQEHVDRGNKKCRSSFWRSREAVSVAKG